MGSFAVSKRHSHAEAIELPDERLLNNWVRGKCCFVPSNKIKKRFLKIVAVNNFLSLGYFDDSPAVLCPDHPPVFSASLVQQPASHPLAEVMHGSVVEFAAEGCALQEEGFEHFTATAIFVWS